MKAIQILIILSFPGFLFSQQIADTTYLPEIPKPEYEFAKGPVVFIDEAHFNFHTKNGRYTAFSNLLERDGYVVKGFTTQFNKHGLDDCKILVISNALNEINVEDWFLPNPSAFSEEEIKVLKKWVRKGGSLFLIADHMPMAGAAKDLAAVFDFEFTNGFVFDTTARGPAFFNIQDNTLHESIMTRGRNTNESVERIASFTGQGFRIPDDATPILRFGKNFINVLPDTAWVFEKETPRYGVEGWSQGAFKEFGKGKVVIFGEAAMFTAQLGGPDKIKFGMNNDVAPENFQLLLNIIHWMDGRLQE